MEDKELENDLIEKIRMVEEKLSECEQMRHEWEERIAEAEAARKQYEELIKGLLIERNRMEMNMQKLFDSLKSTYQTDSGDETQTEE